MKRPRLVVGILVDCRGQSRLQPEGFPVCVCDLNKQACVRHTPEKIRREVRGL